MQGYDTKNIKNKFWESEVERNLIGIITHVSVFGTELRCSSAGGQDYILIGPDVTSSSYLAPLPLRSHPLFFLPCLSVPDSNTPPRAQASPMQVLSFCRQGRARAFVKASAMLSLVGQ
ncbi:hypothetical protein P692DRAFT_20834278 [Suillus brevipes Sb2]|nr:hypothetical protein P692DRAFT_20834278 [Suillus brevipes Sb2]